MRAPTDIWNYEDLHRDYDAKFFELVRGKPVEKLMTVESNWVAGQIMVMVKTFAEGRKLGWVLSNVPIACFIWIPMHARRPHVVFVSKALLPFLESDLAAFPFAPELCVEVLSKHEGAIEVSTKVDEYLHAGVKMIWVVNPIVKDVMVYRQDGTVARLRTRDTITGETVILGFEAKVADFFPPD